MNTPLIEGMSAVEKLLNTPTEKFRSILENSPATRLQKQSETMLRRVGGITNAMPTSTIEQFEGVSKLARNIEPFKNVTNLLDPTISEVGNNIAHL